MTTVTTKLAGGPQLKPKSSHPIDVGNVSLPPELAKSRYGKWRAMSLILVYVLMMVHVVHWKVAGKTMAPLELSEIMKALEQRVVSAGVLFIGIMIIGSAVFGRFFCSWACHMLAAQDLCHWILKRLRIRPRPIRSRVLLLVPLVAAGYMFVWPQFARMLRGYELPAATTRFVTTDFWRDLPGPLIITLTFLVCGFGVIYFFGGRGFCTYGCPYGVLFGLFDRLAPGKIRAGEGCKQCGRCTAICTSSVRVHEQVKSYGMVVDPRCMKDLDCVSVCPNNVLHYRFGRPTFLRKRYDTPPATKYDFSIAEEVAMVVVFIAAVLTWRGLYDHSPFLMSLALSAITAYLTISFARLFYQPQLSVNRYLLKVEGKLLRPGYVFAGVCGLFLLFTVHSAFIQYHKRVGDYLLGRVTSAPDALLMVEERDLLERAVAHLETSDRYGLFSTTPLNMKLGGAHLELDQPERAEPYLRRAVALSPNYPEARLQLATALIETGHTDEAGHHLAWALETYSPHEEYQSRFRRLYAMAHVQLGGLLLQRNQIDDAEQHYRGALTFDEKNSRAFFGLGLGAARRGDFEQAAIQYRRAVEADPEAAEAYANLGDVLLARNDPEGALQSFESALKVDPAIERVQFKMGVINFHLSRWEEAVEHFAAAERQSAEDAELQNYYGMTLESLGRTEEARIRYERAVAVDDAHADAHFNLGRLNAVRGDRAGADRHLRRAIELDARYAERPGR